MNKSLLVIAAVLIFGTVIALAISPYFTESSIDEVLPRGALFQPMNEKDDIMMDETMNEKIPISYSGEFVGAGDGIHDAQGTAYTIPIKDGSHVLRLENFQSTNGPDLFVYLATDENALEFINLGALKANNGNQNYEIPDDTDLDKYGKVLIWCKSFSVLFGSADLST